MKFMIASIFIFANMLVTNMEDVSDTRKDEFIELTDRVTYLLPSFGPLFIDQEKLDYLIEKLKEKVYIDPTNARLDDSGDIIEGNLGKRLDQERFKELFYRYIYEGKSAIIELPTQSVFPRVNSEILAEIYVQKIGNYVTYYKEGNHQRSHNIALSTAAINNQVVFPGEEFSFNKIVGERTKEKGYKKAPVIVKGELAEDIGGGICQVSSTLYNAVGLRGIQIIERYSHSREVPYVPPGKDATVSWWGPDFVFKNKYNHPILIRAKSEKGKMEIDIYSAEDVHYK